MSKEGDIFLRIGILHLYLKVKVVIQCNNLMLDMNTSNIFSPCPLGDPDHTALVLSEAELSLGCHCDHHLGTLLKCYIFMYCAGSYRDPVL